MISALQRQADAAFAAGHHAKAWKIYQQGLASYTDSDAKPPESLYVNAGACLRRLGRQDEAIKLLKQGLGDYPHQASIHNNLANNFADQQADKWLILQHCLLSQLLGQEKQGSAYMAAHALWQLNFPLSAYEVLHRWWTTHAKDDAPDLAIVSLLLELSLTILDEDELEPISSWCLTRLQGSEGVENIPQKLAIMAALARKGSAAEALQLHRQVGALLDSQGNSSDHSSMYVNASWNLAIVLLGDGKMQPGWKLYEYGLRTPSKSPQRWQRALAKLFSAQQVPLWRGEPLPAGTRILLMAEQAVGDTMMFLQLLPELLKRDLVVTLVVPSRLEPIYSRSFPQCRVLSSEQAEQSLSADNFDVQCPVGSLPQHLLADWVAAGNPQTRLSIQAPLAEQLRRQYRKGLGRGKPLIGISWSGGGKRERIRIKSVTVDQMASLMKRLDARFISLQYGNCARQIEAWQHEGIDIIDPSEIDPLKDMDSWLAQVSACDLVISVANTTIHGSALVGVPTFCLLSRSPDWRWTRHDGQGSYWYDMVQVARQSKAGSWQFALDAAVDWVDTMRVRRYCVEPGSAHRQSQSLSFEVLLP